ncbi:MAG: alpha-galactosidase [Clostridiales bacterium]|nr:alpha-galactosidase [Clostridiales bacterium]
MIKIENGILYLTAGEACCVFKVAEDKTLRRVYFGKRVEFEDDVCALLGVRPESEGVRGGDFTFVRAEVLPDKPHGTLPTLVGGKTLVIELEDADKKLKAEIFVTPYSRGGFTRRVRVVNNGEKAVSLDCERTLFELPEPFEVVAVGRDGNIVKGESTPNGANNGLSNFAALLSRGADGNHSDAYGFLSVFGNGAIGAEQTENGMTVTCAPTVKKVKLGAGESVELPEVLLVYSDRGLGGMSRVFHDVVREFMTGKTVDRRPPTVMFATSPEKKLCAAAEVALELGCDVFAVDIGKVSRSSLDKVTAACHDIGIKAGVRINPYNIEKGSAAFGEGYTERTADGKYKVVDLKKFMSAFTALMQGYAFEYALIDLPWMGDDFGAQAMCEFRNEASKLSPELTIEWGVVPRKLRYAETLCYPTALMRTVVTAEAVESGALKTEFDAASVGRLGYELDPLELSDGVKRAIRAQVFSYQDDAPTALFGDLYRAGMTGGKSMTFVSKDKSKAYVVCVPTDGGVHKVFLTGIDEHNLYHVREMNKTFSGAALVCCGVTVGSANSFTLHLRQVADYE